MTGPTKSTTVCPQDKHLRSTIVMLLSLICVTMSAISAHAADNAKTKTTRVTLTYTDPAPLEGEALAERRQELQLSREFDEQFGALEPAAKYLETGGDNQIVIILDLTPSLVYDDNSELIRFTTRIQEVSRWYGDAVRPDELSNVKSEYAITLIKLRNGLKRVLTNPEAERLKQNGSLELDLVNSEFQSVFSEQRRLSAPRDKLTLIYTPKDPLPNIRIVKLGAAQSTPYEPGKLEFGVPFWVEVFYESEPFTPPTDVELASTEGPFSAPLWKLGKDEPVWRTHAIILEKKEEEEEDPFADIEEDPFADIDDGVPTADVPDLPPTGCEHLTDSINELGSLERTACELEKLGSASNVVEPVESEEDEFVWVEIPGVYVNNYWCTKPETGDKLVRCSYEMEYIKDQCWVPKSVAEKGVDSCEEWNDADAASSDKTSGESPPPDLEKPDVPGSDSGSTSEQKIVPSSPQVETVVTAPESLESDDKVKAVAPTEPNAQTSPLLDNDAINLKQQLPDLKGIATTPTNTDLLTEDDASDKIQTDISAPLPLDEENIEPLEGTVMNQAKPSSVKEKPKVSNTPNVAAPPENMIPLGIDKNNSRTLNLGVPAANPLPPELGDLEGTPFGDLVTKLGTKSPIVTQLLKDGIQPSDQATAKILLQGLQ